MRARGLDPDFPADALRQAAALQSAPRTTEEPVSDLRSVPWCSIDNDESRDLDQLSAAEELAGGATRVRVAIADVDAAVPRSSPLDRHAAVNTTSVYTPAAIFPMPPELEAHALSDLRPEPPNRAKALIEDLSIAANGVCARFLDAHGFPSLRRVVKAPARWDRIVSLAAATGDRLPSTPDPRALAEFLARRRDSDPAR